MYCPNCGKADQQENTYCRQCGEFLSNKNNGFGGKSPEDMIRTNLVLNLLSAIVSLSLALLLYLSFAFRPETEPLIYIVAAFLLAMCAWQFSTFIVGLKLRGTFKKRRRELEEEKEQIQFKEAKTQEFLPEADFENIVPSSVTENTTKHLGEKVKRKSS